MRMVRTPLWLKLLASALAVGLVAGAGFVAVKIVALRSSITSAPLNLGTDHVALPVDQSTDPLQILLLGTDSRKDTGGKYGGDPPPTASGKPGAMCPSPLSAEPHGGSVG